MFVLKPLKNCLFHAKVLKPFSGFSFLLGSGCKPRDTDIIPSKLGKEANAKQRKNNHSQKSNHPCDQRMDQQVRFTRQDHAQTLGNSTRIKFALVEPSSLQKLTKMTGFSPVASFEYSAKMAKVITLNAWTRCLDELSSDESFHERSARCRAVKPSSGSNVMPRRARPGLAGLRLRTRDAWT